ncbi:unnamed protein product, partial [Rotaria sp. Silwood1]
GFLAGSKIYVDFADKDGEEFDKAYDLLIEELKRNGLNDTNGNKDNTTTSGTVTETESKPEEPKKSKESQKLEESKKSKEPKKESEQPCVQTRQYLNVPLASMWNDQHVKEFLTDHQLDQLLPICESMDGEAIIEFHHSCETKPDIMYGLINKSKEHPLSFGIYFKFIAKLKKYLPQKSMRKIYFQYKFVYPSSSTTESATTEKENNQPL